jgi:type VI secretion system secreted protein VgrG
MNLSPDFAGPPDGDARLLQLRTALPDAADLLPERATMREAVGRPFELELDCVSPAAHPALDRLIGEQMTVRLKQADGGYAPWHGYVLQAARLGGGDGPSARYRLVLGPWLAWLALRLDSFVFQDRTALQIVEDVFADYPAAQWRVQAADATRAAMRSRSVCTQYRESDLAFVDRLLAQEGLHYWFEHLDGSAGAEADRQGRARHVLVIADAQAERADLGPIRFSGQRRSARTQRPEDPIDTFAAERRLTANAVALGSWDPAKLAGTAARAASAPGAGDLPALEAYDGAGADRYPDQAAADRAAALALAAAELEAERFAGTGEARTLRAGACFSLVDHPGHGASAGAEADGAFTVLAVEHTVRNDLGAVATHRPGHDDAPGPGTYRNRFACVRRAVPVVLPAPRAPAAPAALTARVVGLAGAQVHSERGHRVKVQMHFQRGQSPNAGGSPTGFGTDAAGNAPGDERSGAWVRVAGPAAGAGWGSVYTPRVGSEVTVAFLDGDIDRPVVTGGLHGGTDTHPFAAGIDSGVDHPGVIGGLHSRTLGAAGFNQLALDDAPGQLRARLHSSHADAELGLGHLIQQPAHGAQRGAARGTGFEAGTAGWANLRAAQGLLLSSTARAGTYASARGAQMEAGEGIARLAGARELGQRLNRAARAVQAQGLRSHDDGQSIDRYLGAVAPERDGRHADQVAGQSARLPDADGRSPGESPVPAFDRPVAMLDTPAALLAASEASISAFAAQSLGLTAHGDLQQTAARTLSQVSGATASLYAHQGGIRATAAHGPLSLRAHTDALSILADASVTIVSVDDGIRIAARQRIELVAGQSSIVLDDGDIEIKTPGAFTVHGATHAFEGGGSLAGELPALPTGTATEAPDFMELNLVDEWMMPVAGAPYVVAFDDGSVRKGHLDGNGHARLEGVPRLPARVFYGEDPADPQARVAMPENDFKAGSQTNEEAEARIAAYLDRCDLFWREQATGEQRECHADMNADADEPEGENAWHFLDEARQQALRAELEKGES